MRLGIVQVTDQPLVAAHTCKHVAELDEPLPGEHVLELDEDIRCGDGVTQGGVAIVFLDMDAEPACQGIERMGLGATEGRRRDEHGIENGMQEPQPHLFLPPIEKFHVEGRIVRHKNRAFDM